MDCDYDNVRWVTTVNDSGGLVLLSSSDFLSGIKTVFVKVYLGEVREHSIFTFAFVSKIFYDII